MGHTATGGAAGEGGERVEAVGGRRLAPVTGQTLRDHFHLPLHTVAQRFGMCTTAFKKMCRRLGIAKWPHRQVLPPPIALRLTRPPPAPRPASTAPRVGKGPALGRGIAD